MVKCRFVVYLDSPIDDPTEEERYAAYEATFVRDGKLPFVPPIGMVIESDWVEEFRVDSLHYDIRTGLLSVTMQDYLGKVPVLRSLTRDGIGTWGESFSRAHDSWSASLHCVDPMSEYTSKPWGAFAAGPTPTRSEFVGIQPWAPGSTEVQS